MRAISAFIGGILAAWLFWSLADAAWRPIIKAGLKRGQRLELVLFWGTAVAFFVGIAVVGRNPIW